MEVDYLEVCGSKSRRSNSSGTPKRKAASPKRLPTDIPMPKSRPLRRRILENGWGENLVAIEDQREIDGDVIYGDGVAVFLQVFLTLQLVDILF